LGVEPVDVKGSFMSAVGPLKGEALAQAIDVAVMKKGLDNVEMQGEAAVKLIEDAGQAAAPRAVRAPKHPDLGNLIDTYI
jgi:hypothetical protein